jgi:hypothetical protein
MTNKVQTAHPVIKYNAPFAPKSNPILLSVFNDDRTY